MISNISDRLSKVIIKKSPEESFDQERLSYGIKFILSNLIPIAIILLYGTFVDDLKNIFLALISFITLRMVSGGYHIKSAELCIAVSSIMILSISKYSVLISGYEIYLNIVSLMLVIFLSPSNIRRQTRLPKDCDKYLKSISIIIVLVNIFIGNGISTVSLFVQSLLLIRLKGGE